MPRLSWEDRDVFLDDFAFEAVPAKGQPFKCIPDEEYGFYEMDDFGEVRAKPTFLAKSEDVSQLHVHDIVVIAGVKYFLTEDPAPDGTGFSTVRMQRSNSDGGWYDGA